MRRRGVILVVVSLLLGVFAATSANSWLNTRLLAEDESDEGKIFVVAAALPIPYGTKVSSRHLKMVKLSEDAIPVTAVKNMEDVEGFVAKSGIEPNQLILSTSFAEHNEGSTLAALVAPNMRAISVRVNDVAGVAGFLLPGNRVDVISTRGGRRGNSRANASVVLTNIKVLAVDQTTSTDQNEPIIVRAVTLELRPDQALDLSKARIEGEIQLALRNPLDNQVVEEKPATAPVKPAIRPQRVARRAAPKRSTATTIEVIRGTKVQEEKAKL